MNNDLKNKVQYKISMYKFYEEKKQVQERFNYKKLVYLSGFLFLTFTTVVNAKTFVKLFGLNASDGVDIAVKNNYLEEVDMEYLSFNNDLKMKVNRFLIDNYNLDINFELDSSKYNLEDGFSFNDLIICDEKNNIIFDSQGNNLSNATSVNGKQIHLTIYADHIPIIKMLNIHFSDITINNKNIKGNDIAYTLNVSEHMQSRDTIKYHVVSSNIANANFEEANLSNTALIIKFSNGNSNYQLLDNHKNIWDIPKNNNTYIELKDGTRIDLAGRSDMGGVSIRQDKIEFEYIFNLTKFTNCDDFKVHIVDEDNDMIIHYAKVEMN